MSSGVGRVSDIVVPTNYTPQTPAADSGAPVFTTAPQIVSPTGGSQTYTAVDGVATGSMQYNRRWLLDGVFIGRTRRITVTSNGSLVLEVTVTGTAGQTVVQQSAPVQIGAPVVPQTLRSFTAGGGIGKGFNQLPNDSPRYNTYAPFRIVDPKVTAIAAVFFQIAAYYNELQAQTKTITAAWIVRTATGEVAPLKFGGSRSYTFPGDTLSTPAAVLGSAKESDTFDPRTVFSTPLVYNEELVLWEKGVGLGGGAIGCGRPGPAGAINWYTPANDPAAIDWVSRPAATATGGQSFCAQAILVGLGYTPGLVATAFAGDSITLNSGDAAPFTPVGGSGYAERSLYDGSNANPQAGYTIGPIDGMTATAFATTAAQRINAARYASAASEAYDTNDLAGDYSAGQENALFNINAGTWLALRRVGVQRIIRPNIQPRTTDNSNGAPFSTNWAANGGRDKIVAKFNAAIATGLVDRVPDHLSAVKGADAYHWGAGMQVDGTHPSPAGHAAMAAASRAARVGLVVDANVRAPLNFVAPSVTSTSVQAGTPITLDNGVWGDVYGVTPSYQWRNGNTPIAGATGASYTPALTTGYQYLYRDTTYTNSFGSTTISTLAATFLPSSLMSAVVAWFDPRVGVSADGAGNVTSWTDRIGGKVLTPSISSPTYSSTGLNGRPAVTFNGTNQNLQNGSAVGYPSGSAASTLATAAHKGPSNANNMLFGYGNFAAEQMREMGVVGTTAVGNTQQSNTNGPQISDADAVWIWEMPAGANPTGMFTANGGASTTTAMPTQNTGTGGVVIGIWLNNNNFVWDGAVQDQILLNRVLTQAERDGLAGFIAWANNMQAALVAGAVYKNAAP